MNTKSAIYNKGTRSSTYNKTATFNKAATYNTNASSTMAPRKTSYSLDLRKTSYNMNARAATSYHAASSTVTNKIAKTPYQTTATYQIALSNSSIPNEVAADATYGTNANSVAYNVGKKQLEYTLDFDTIAKLIAPQQVIYTGATSAVSSQKATTKPSNSQMSTFNTSTELTAPNISSSRPPDPQVLTLNDVLGKPITETETQTKLPEPQPALNTNAKSTATILPPNTKQSGLQIVASTNNIVSSKNSPSGRFTRLATSKSSSNAGTSNIFVKTRPNTVVRAELIKNKSTKRTEPVNSVSRTKDDEYKTGKKPKPAFKTKLVNKYCTYYHKYGRCKEGDFCAYKHDSNRVEVCKLWLKGSECTLGSKCPLQHVESAHLIPYCRHFCKGMCLKDDCHYTHVKVSKRAPHCKDFMVGRYCPAGIDCRKKHEWGLYEEPTETESEAGKKRTRDLAEEEVEREKIKKLREEMANGVNPFAAGWTFIPIDD